MADTGLWKKPKHIVVTGDVVCDFYVVRPPRAPAGYREPLEYANMELRLGGAWYLKQLIDLACSDLTNRTEDEKPTELGSPDEIALPEVVIHEPERDGAICLPDDDSLAHAFSIVAHHDRIKGKSKNKTKDDEVWRIAEFLGCRAPKQEIFAQRHRDLYKRTVTLSENAAPDVIVIDDQNLGFRSLVPDEAPPSLGQGSNETVKRHGPASWEDVLPLKENDKSPPHIILKTGTPLTPNPLLNWLTKHFPQHLTIIVSVKALRERGASVPDGLSWDSSLEGLNKELDSGPSASDIAKASQVLVYFGSAGVASYRRESPKAPLAYHRLVFHPASLAGDWVRSRPGTMFGATSILTASIVRMTLDTIFDQDARDAKDRFSYKNACRTCSPSNKVPTKKKPADREKKSETDAAEDTTLSPFEASRYPFFVAVARSLAAIRAYVDDGLGPVDKNSTRTPAVFKRDTSAAGSNATEPTFSESTLRRNLHPPIPRKEDASENGDTTLPEDDYRAAFPTSELSNACREVENEVQSLPAHHNLLMESTGHTPGEVLSKAVEVACYGGDKALQAAPKAHYGNYLTVDREEVEHINSIRSLILGYLDNPDDKKPLSLAVFGPPGSGKSFAIKELLGSVYPGAGRPLEFNLSQIRENSEDLHRAFHVVRDASIKGEIPLVFWDEFDTSEGRDTQLLWLKHFLAPMQDAEFREHGIVHAFGKAIFIFAGGTSVTYERFDASLDVPNKKRDNQSRLIDVEAKIASFEESESRELELRELERARRTLLLEARELDKRLGDFRRVKGPDFVSRLRGYLDIKGPNRQGESDIAYLLRRALLFRSTIERNYPQLIDRDSKRANVDSNVISAFLLSERYSHGSRSLEAIVKMSSLEDATYFGPSHLPSEDLRIMHISPDFTRRLEPGSVDEEAIESLAARMHQKWYDRKREKGYRYGEKRSDTPPLTHHLMKPYQTLSEYRKDSNRDAARVLSAHLLRLRTTGPGKAHDPDQLNAPLSSDEKTTLALIAHDQWLRANLAKGVDHACMTIDRVKLHKDVAQYDLMEEDEKSHDQDNVEALAQAIADGELRLANVFDDRLGPDDV